METMVDTHAHLTFEDFKADRDAVVSRAKESGVERMVIIGSGDGCKSAEDAAAMALSSDRFRATAGVHPHDAAMWDAPAASRIKEIAGRPHVAAVGETGLDYYRDLSPRDAQQRAFREQIRIALGAGKPLVIHCRDAHEDTLRILDEEEASRVGGVVHCFSGDAALAKRYLRLNFSLGVTGVVTRKNAVKLHDVVATFPVEDLVLETDCPYLAPEPHRGKRNEPAYIPLMAAKVAEIKGLAVDDVARVTSISAARIFGMRIERQLEPKIVYSIRDALYINLTNRCTSNCVFCPKRGDFIVKGHFLKLAREPEAEEVIRLLAGAAKYREVVFCGLGEPTQRLEVLLEVAKHLRSIGVKRIRLDTDGLADLVHGRNVLPEMKGLIDVASVSMNAADAGTYARLCPSQYGEKAYEALRTFLREAKKYIPEVIATVVALPGLDVSACRRAAEDELGVGFRVRPWGAG